MSHAPIAMTVNPDQIMLTRCPTGDQRDRFTWNRRGLFLLCLAAGACAVFLIRTSSPRPASPAETAPAQPVLTFDRTSLDLGTIVATEEGETARFPFTNTGTAPLHLREIVTGCGCAGARVDRALVPPGEQGNVIVNVRSERPEEKQVRLAVLTNEPSGAAHELVLKWRARFPIELEVERISFGQLAPGETVTRRLRVIRHPGLGPVEISSVTAVPQSALKVAHRSSTPDEPGPTESIEVTLQPVEAPSSLQHGTIKLALQGGWKEFISIPVDWSVRDMLEVTPRHLVAGYAEAGSHANWTVRIAARGEEQLEIEGIDLPAETFLRVRASQLDEHEVRLDVQGVLPDRPGPFSQEIQVRLSGPRPRKVVIGCSGVIREKAARSSL